MFADPSQEHVLHQLRDVIQVRERWLELSGLPMTFQMGDKERKDFLEAAKAEFHGSVQQRLLQQSDAKDEPNKVRDRKHSRWSRELQRRCGNKVVWEIVSFTGRVDLAFPLLFPTLDNFVPPVVVTSDEEGGVVGA